MLIQCPKCHANLEATDDMFGRNVRCCVCNTKFSLFVKTTLTEFPVLFPDTKQQKKSKLLFLDPNIIPEVNSLVNSKGLRKYYKLFLFAPRSIKLVVLYNLIWFSICFSASIVLHMSSASSGFLNIYLLFPLLRRKAWSRYCLLAIYLLCLLVTILSLFCTWDDEFFVDTIFLPCIAYTIIRIPVFIALLLSSTRLWVSSKY